MRITKPKTHRQCIVPSKLACVFCLCFPSFAMGAVAPQHTVDDETGAESWQISVDGVTVSLTQILPDQARTSDVNRGFSAEVI